MFDAKQLLNMLAGGQVAGAAAIAPDSGLAGELNRGAQVAGQVASQAGAAVSGVLAGAEAKLQGTKAGEILDQAKDLGSRNPMATGAALGGLAAILLGTQTGRAIAGDAAKLGGLAAIGGLAYKALRNYQDGKPLTAGVPGLEQLTPAPSGSAFSEDAHTHDTALVMIRSMVATAAADGTVNPSQRTKILGEMQAAGLSAEGAQFLDNEIQHPATVADIAAAVGGSQELALQAYSAAHLVAATQPEKAFLDELAKALKLDANLVAHLNEVASASAPPAQ